VIDPGGLPGTGEPAESLNQCDEVLCADSAYEFGRRDCFCAQRRNTPQGQIQCAVEAYVVHILPAL